MERIYLDHAATSPIHPRVIEKMAKAMGDFYGNPSSIHSFGREARHLLDEARHTLAKGIGAGANEIIFTSGGTEADNLAILGVAESYNEKGRHIITTEIEHHAVLHACQRLEKQGFTVTYLPVDETGRISISELEQALTDETILVTIMYGNNEVGTIQPIEKIGKLLSSHQALFHTDAVQAYGLIDIDVNKAGIDLLSVSAHKINGPKGTGFLFAKDGIKLSPRSFGGEQERKRRAGTENLVSILGFMEAAQLAAESREEKAKHHFALKKRFIEVLEEESSVFELNGSLENSLPHIVNLSFPGTNVEAMLVNLDLAGIAVSSGSACTAGSIEPSHVLVAMFGRESERIANSIRFSFGLGTTEADIVRAAKETAKITRRLRG
ncbi:cysteine desulfurase NifS [Bacillus sp. FJAT-27225]|uniref:cysteine desulfurase family protein n=1 Tax=Bacillus sp. FJAT-27225 TaxID=1743144 RepID=UPI00080C2A95|nr:cysteine desulfurase family protein [Bacillus sp. FJAT-27225]OCA91214.1 cysteine desulfurase NifS [Bacillus sp. FJAT-27225]